MSIADKLITIADNTSAVAEAVNASKATVSGTVIRVDDVLDAEHELKVHASAEVNVYGKNLIETESVDAEADKSKVLFEGSINGNFVFSCLFDYTACGTPTAAQFEFTVDGAVQYMARGSTDKVSKKLSGTLTRIRFLNWGYGVGTVEEIQLEVGTVATEYESYKKPQTATADADGKVEGLKSVSPTMTVVGTDVECTYFPTSAADTYEKYQQLKAAEVALIESI